MYTKPDIELRLSGCEEKLDWAVVYANTNPVEIEFGCGKGRFIIRSAQENPTVNYFGIEKSGKYFRILKDRVVKAALSNARLLKGEAGYFIKKYVPENSVQAYHIYFPDPWPKKRHHKRRLVTPEFIGDLQASLIPGGCIFMATDFEDYFDVMVACARAYPVLQELYCRVITPEEANPEEALTNYERKYLLQGRPIYKAAFRKTVNGE